MSKKNAHKKHCDDENKIIKFTAVTPENMVPVPLPSPSPSTVFLPLAGSCNETELVVKHTSIICDVVVKIESKPRNNIFALDTFNNIVSFNIPTSSRDLCKKDKKKKKVCRPIVGLAAGQVVIGIDFNPTNGLLYAVARGPGGLQLYTLNLSNPCQIVATPAGPVIPVSLTGTEFGVNFDPVTGLLRVVSNTGENIVINPNTNTFVVEGNLNFAIGDINFGRTPAVSAIAFTNSFPGAVTTTLFAIDTNQNVLATINPALTGTLNTVGPLGIDVLDVLGFDIQAGTNIAYAILTVRNSSFGPLVVNHGCKCPDPCAQTNLTGLFIINLTTGAATLIKRFKDCKLFRGLAVLPLAPLAITFTLLVNGIPTSITGTIETIDGCVCNTIPGPLCLQKCDRISVQVTVTSTTGLPPATKLVLKFELQKTKKCCPTTPMIDPRLINSGFPVNGILPPNGLLGRRLIR